MASRRACLLGSAALAFAPSRLLFAQQPRLHRIGVIHHGGPYAAAVEGLRDGLKELGFEERKQFVFHQRDAKGELTAVAAIARDLEAEQVDVIYSVTTSITRETRRGTKSVPIVFYAGTDPAAVGLVAQLREPGGRLTGIYSRFTDLTTAKRLELLKQMAPKMRRVLTYYNPQNVSSRSSTAAVREAARQLKLELLERHVTSVEELQASLRALKPGDADAISHVVDAMVISQSDLIVEVARRNKMLTIFSDRATVAKGGLAAYGESYDRIGRLSAKFVHRVLQGANPATLPVEQLDRIHFVINLRTAKEIGLDVPQVVLTRADEVIR